MNRTTVLVGAGGAVEIGAPSTWKLTQKVVNEKYKVFESLKSIKQRDATLVKDIYERLKKGMGKTHTEPNFETIFHVMELLYSHNTVWTDALNASICPPFAYVINKPRFLNAEELKQSSSIARDYILAIMDEINKYDEDFRLNKDTTHRWYRDFWQGMPTMDVFNLNYDNTIQESVARYKDGFGPNKHGDRFLEFDAKDFFTPTDDTVICSLHGNIHFFNDRGKDINAYVYEHLSHDLYKYSSYAEVHDKYRGSGGSNETNQASEQLFNSPLLTGLRKPDKLVAEPLNFYHSYLTESIVRNNSLLVVGYSFGDTYINDLLVRLNAVHGDKTRVVLITYWQPDTEDNTFRYLAHNYDKVNFGELLFIKRIMQDDTFEHYRLDSTISSEGFYVSPNRRIMILPYKFMSAVQKHQQAIYDFLKS